MSSNRRVTHNHPTRRPTLHLLERSRSEGAAPQTAQAALEAMSTFQAPTDEDQTGEDCELIPTNDTRDDSDKNYPSIIVTPSDITLFEKNMNDTHDPLSSAEHCLHLITRWMNTSHSVDKRRHDMHMAFRSWFDVMRAFHLVEERRARRELGKVAKKLLRKPPKKRKPQETLKLIKFHNISMSNMKDYSDFKTFGSLNKKQLQVFYKHVTLKVLKKGSPIFLQGTAGFGYFIMLSGSLKIFTAADKRQREIINELSAHVLKEDSKGSTEDTLGGFCGRPLHNVVVEEGAQGVGFGGVQMMGGGGNNYVCSAVCAENCEIIVVDPTHYKLLLLADHKAKYILAERINRIDAMPAFKKMAKTQVEHFAEDFVNNVYIKKSVLVARGDQFNKIIVINRGEVCVYAIVEDPRVVGRLLEVEVITAGSGSIIGDVELVSGTKIFGLKAVAITAEVETYEIDIPAFKRHLYSQHSVQIRLDLENGVREKKKFHADRIKGEMLKFAHYVRKMEEDRIRLGEHAGDVVDRILHVREEWEREYMDFMKKQMVPFRVRPAYDYVHEDLFLKRDVHSSSGVRVMSRQIKIPEPKRNEFIPEVVKDFEAPPYFDQTLRGSSRGGSRKDARLRMSMTR